MKGDNIYSEEELIEDLQKLADKLGKTPTMMDVNGYKMMASAHTYGRRFDSYSDACIAAGLEPNSSSNNKYSKEFMIEQLQKLAKQLGKTPTIIDVANCDYCPSHYAYVQYFDGYRNACLAAGLEPNKRGAKPVGVIK